MNSPMSRQAVSRSKPAKRRKTLTPRDPFWRLRRIFGERKVKNPKAYDRAASRKAERESAVREDARDGGAGDDD